MGPYIDHGKDGGGVQDDHHSSKGFDLLSFSWWSSIHTKSGRDVGSNSGDRASILKFQ